MKLRTSIVAPLTLIAALAAVPAGYAANDGTPGAHRPVASDFGDCPHDNDGKHNGYDCFVVADAPAPAVDPGMPAGAPGPAGPQGPADAPGAPAADAPRGAVLGAQFRSCVSRRHFTIRIRQRKGAHIVKATVILRGKAVKTVKGKRVTAPIVLRGLPKGAFTLRIRAVTTQGKVLNGTRTYHTCTAKKRHHVPSL